MRLSAMSRLATGVLTPWFAGVTTIDGKPGLATAGL